MEKTGQWSDKSVIKTPELIIFKISLEKILSMREKVILLGLLALTLVGLVIHGKIDVNTTYL
jgi:hypothetical protein